MGTQWIRASYREMQQNIDASISDMGFLLENNESLIERYVFTVDKKLKQPIILKLPTYP